MRVLIVAAFALMVGSVARAEPISVVASFSVLADMVETVGGDRVAVTALVGPGGDPHVYRPTPRDAAELTEADLLVVNGLGFEGWLERLIEAAGYDGPIVVAARSLAPMDDGHEAEHHPGEVYRGHAAHHGEEDEHEHGAEVEDDAYHHGPTDPHAWHSPVAAKAYVAAIADGLIAADSASATTYATNRDAYLGELDALDTALRETFAALPQDRRTVVTNHDAFGYFGREYGLRFLAPQGFSTEADPSARDVARLIEELKGEGADALFVESGSDERLLRQIAEETGASIGGTLYAGSLSDADGPAATYLQMMRHNAGEIAGALAGD